MSLCLCDQEEGEGLMLDWTVLSIRHLYVWLPPI